MQDFLWEILNQVQDDVTRKLYGPIWDKRTDGKLLALRPEIPWHQVFGLRNRIAHGYFDIDIDVISSIIKEDMPALLVATDYLLNHLDNTAVTL